MGIDYGTKRTGIAISDVHGKIAFPFKTIDTTELLQELKKIVKQEKVDTLVIGQPKYSDNTTMPIEQEILSLIIKIREEMPGLIIERYDERYTSKIAARDLVEMGLKKSKRRDKRLLDQISATLILQSYLDRQQRR